MDIQNSYAPTQTDEEDLLKRKKKGTECWLLRGFKMHNSSNGVVLIRNSSRGQLSQYEEHQR